MIELRNLRKTYDLGGEPVHALNGITLTIEDHEFVAIVGASGSGKSTLMNMIGCLDTPDEGDYFIDGQNVTELSEHDLAIMRNRKIGFIFQQFNLLPKLTAFENVELPLIYQGVSGKERRERTLEALKRVGLEKRIGHRPNQLSGGQQQRVAVARALVTRPTLILADEPTGNLDSKSTGDIMALLRELHSQGNTIVLITHDDAIAAEAPRQVRILDGKIVSEYRQESPENSGDSGDAPENCADIRGDSVDIREDSADIREDSADIREDSADIREDSADIRGIPPVSAGIPPVSAGILPKNPMNLLRKCQRRCDA